VSGAGSAPLTGSTGPDAWGLLVGRLGLHALLFVLLLTPYFVPGGFVPAVEGAWLVPLVAVAFLSTAGFAVALWRGARGRLLVEVQLACDLLLAGWLVGLTDGASSPFCFLFLLILCGAMVSLPPRRGVVWGGAVVAVYGAVAWLAREATAAWSQVSVTVMALVATAGLAHRLAQTQRRERADLYAQVERYHELQALYGCVVRSIHSGLVTVDTSLRVTTANPSAERLLARQRPLAGRTVDGLFMLLPGQTWVEVLAAGGRIECGVCDDDERERTVGLTASPLRSEGGREIGWVVSFQDLTEVKRLERHVQAQERLAAIGELSARLAHEVRNPLGAISGAAQVLAAEAGAEVAEADRRLLEIVVRESSRLSRLVEDFLSFARSRTGRVSPVDLRRVAEEVVETVRMALPDTSGAVELVVEGEPLEVVLDGDAVRQCLLNLVQNGVDSLSGRGRVAITVGRTEDGDAALVEVADTGCGISESAIEQIFFPFVSHREGGTGLGLSVVKGLVEAHGGGVEVTSRVGEGSRFVLTWPVAASIVHPVLA